MTNHKKYKNYKRQDVMIHNHPQPEVIACQGGGEMFKSHGAMYPMTDDVRGSSSRNSPADVHSQERKIFCNSSDLFHSLGIRRQAIPSFVGGLDYEIYCRDLTPFEENQLRTNHPQIYKFLNRWAR